MDKIFIMNLGTTSFKFKLYQCDAQTHEILAEGELESVGTGMSHWSLNSPDSQSWDGALPIPDHGVAFTHFIRLLQEKGILKDVSDLDAVGYKAVHGGTEAGVFRGLLPGLDIVGIGPNSGGAHTPEEWVDLCSYERAFNLLLGILDRLCDEQ